MKTMRFLWALCALVLCAPAQVVRVQNYGQAVFGGWHRTTVDRLPPHLRGRTVDGIEYAVGRQIGLLGYCVDLRLKLAPGQAAKVDLAASSPIDADAPLLTEDLVGRPLVTGTKLVLARTSVGGRENPLVDGAGTTMHWSGRPWASAPMFHVDVWATCYPRQPWSVGEMVITASNPTVPDLVATVPIGGLVLGWTDGVAIVDGMQLGAPLLAGGETLGTGQSRAWRFVFGSLSRSTISDVQSALVESAAGIAANGIERPGLLGAVSPVPVGFDGLAWARQRLPSARAALSGWAILRDQDGGSVGVSARAGDTGDQEDQPGLNKGSEEYAPNGLGCYWVTYYAALGQLRRPTNHLEADGSPLDFDSHPGLVMYAAQPHWEQTAGTDHLGKSRPLALEVETHGWSQDREHWLLGRFGQALQWTGSPALQWGLAHQARVFWFQETTDPKWTTSHSDASRSWGWQAIVSTWLWLGLEDRGAAQRMRLRERDRVALVYAREFTTMRPAAWIDVRKVTDPGGDARIRQEIGSVFAWGTLAYQQPIASLMRVAGEIQDNQQQRDLADLLARTCIDYGWTQQGTTWLAWDMIGVQTDGTPLRADQYLEGAGAHRTGWFDCTWCAPAVWVVLRSSPRDARAAAIWQQLQALPPGRPLRANDWLLPQPARTWTPSN